MISYHYVDGVSLIWGVFNSKIAALSNKANIRFFLPVFEKDRPHPKSEVLSLCQDILSQQLYLDCENKPLWLFVSYYKFLP